MDPYLFKRLWRRPWLSLCGLVLSLTLCILLGYLSGHQQELKLQLEETRTSYDILCVVTDALCAHGNAVWKALRDHRYLQFIPCLPPMTEQTPSYAPTEEHYACFLSDIFRGYYRDFRAGSPVSVQLQYRKSLLWQQQSWS